MTISDLIYGHARRIPDAPAFIQGDHILSWREFDRSLNRVANRVLEIAPDANKSVGLLTNNSLWSYVAKFGVIRSGRVPALLSSMLQASTVEALAVDASIAAMFVSEGLERLSDAALAGMPEVVKVEESNPEDSFQNQSDEMPDVRIPVTAPYSIIYSSGTTGRPKGIIHSHLARLWFCYEMGVRFGITQASSVIVSTPPYSNGTNLCMLPAVYRGGSNIIMPSFSVDSFLDLVERWQPTHAFLVPTQFQRIVEHPRSRDIDWSCFEMLITAGAPMPEPLRRKVIDLVGPVLSELWGLTEGIGAIISPQEMMQHMGSVGRVAPGSDIRLVNDEDAEIPSGIGEIVGRSLMMMDSYHNRPDANEEIVWRDQNGLPFLRTGDLGEFDDNGYLWIRGRAKDMIISGGFNIYPVDIEAVLQEHEAVIDAAVFGISDPDWGETPVAYIVADSNADDSSESILSWVNNRLAKPQRLRGLKIIEGDFPRNALGKPLKTQLKEMFEAAGQSARTSE